MCRFLVTRYHGEFPDRATAEADARARYGPKGYVRVVAEVDDAMEQIERDITRRNRRLRGLPDEEGEE